MDILLYILVAAGGLCIGIFIGRVTVKVNGRFIVDESDENITRWTIDVDFDPKELPDKKEVRLKVCKMEEGDV